MNKEICENWIQGVNPSSLGQCVDCETLCEREYAEKNYKDCPYTGHKEETMLDIKFPKFKTMISSSDFESELQMLKDCGLYSKDNAAQSGVKIILDENLPAGTALLIDKDQKIVAVIQDSKVVEIK